MKPALRWIVLGIVVLAILIRLVVAFALGDFALPVSGAYDQVSYDALAQRLIAGYGFSFATDSYPFVPANEPTAHWSFLYTLYLAGVYAIFGHHPLAARIIQVILSGAQCWLVYRIGRRLFGEGVGIASAALTALYAYFIFFNAALMTQTFYIIALLLAIDIALDLSLQSEIRNPCPERSRRVKSEIPRWLLLGLALGIAALMRQTILLFAPFLFVYIWWMRRNSQSCSERSRRVATRHSPLSPFTAYRSSRSIPAGLFTGILLSLSVIAALVLPWTIRNYFVYNDFLLLNSNGGFWLYSSNHPDQGTSFDGTYVAPIPEYLRGLNEAAMDRALYREAIGFIVGDPQRFLLLTFSRIEGQFLLAPTAWSSLTSNVARLGSFALFLPLMLYGILLSLRQWRACSLLFLYIGFDNLLCLVSWAGPRYRLPSDAVAMVFAGLAFVDITRRVIGNRMATEISNWWRLR